MNRLTSSLACCFVGSLALACSGSGSPGSGVPAPTDAGATQDTGPTGEDRDADAGGREPEKPRVSCADYPFSRADCEDPDAVEVLKEHDSDGDGLTDHEELCTHNTDQCDEDTDGDGLGDLAEVAYERVNCPDGPGSDGIDCGCATSASCQIPPEHYYLVLPYGEDPLERDLDFGTTIRVADVFFLTDTTGSMGSTLNNVKNTVATPGTGLIDRIRETIPNAWFGGGQHDDFPFGSYGGGADEPFILAIGMTPPERAEEVQTAFRRMDLHGGGDLPESQTEAIFQILTGEGGSWTHTRGASYTMRSYAGDCLDAGWGAPCFRDEALPIIVHFTDVCAHEGPPGESGSCNPYSGIEPEPATWSEMVAVANSRGARYVGVNSSSSRRCTSPIIGPEGSSPCWFMKRTAEETGSVDLDGKPLVYNLPDGGASDAAFVDTVVGAIETIATRVPLDVDTALRDDPEGPADVDATRFIKRRTPACKAMPPTDPCWFAPGGVEHEQAVATIDMSTFFGVIPGTEVKFRITFQNDFLEGGETAEVYIAFIDVRAGGSSVLDTRQVFIVVPAGVAPVI